MVIIGVLYYLVLMVPIDIYNMGQRFKAVAKEHAKRVALAFPGSAAMNYEALDALSDRAATHMLDMGVAQGNVVAIYAEKSVNTYAAMIAALKLGAPYVVLDTESPPARIEKIIENCKPALILTDRDFPLAYKNQLSLSGLEKDAPSLPESKLAQVNGNAIAYIMFTSGSTGSPKGVAISHASMLNFCHWARDTFAITPEDRLSGANALYFDNSVFDFTASLFNGASLTPISRDIVTQPKQLIEATKSCSIWFSVPSLLIYLGTLKALSADSWPRMRAIIFGGEGFPKAELAKLHKLYGKQATLWNVYGPTECTCICSAYAIRESDFEDMQKLAPLGHLADKFIGAVIDESGTREVATGQTGELFLMGPQVAIGYYNNPELSRAAFAPFKNQPCYRTGDLVWQDPKTGHYHFAGRKDNQIKHMGYRIELEEIEAMLASISAVNQAAVIYQKGAGAAGRIVAFVCADEKLSPSDIQEKLRAMLPSYMVPHEVILETILPKNANGKIDRKALAEKLGEL